MGLPSCVYFASLINPCSPETPVFGRKQKRQKEFPHLGGLAIRELSPFPCPRDWVSASGAGSGGGGWELRQTFTTRIPGLLPLHVSEKAIGEDQVCRSFWHMDFLMGACIGGGKEGNRSERTGDGEAARFSKCCCWTARLDSAELFSLSLDLAPRTTRQNARVDAPLLPLSYSCLPRFKRGKTR